jgi:hypothetical protein
MALDPHSDERRCEISSLEYGAFTLLPGGSLRIGRHKDNNIVLDDASVSRFHARLTWDAKIERPVVFDNGSQNGTLVDEHSVKTAEPLRDKAAIAIGPFILRVKLLGCGETPALLRDANDMVTLFSDDGPEEEAGVIGPGVHGIRELLERLENERRTGTLRIEAEIKASAVLCLGRLMTASVPGYGAGLRALERILAFRRGSWRFTRELEPQEEALNMWVSDFIRARDRTDEETTQRFKGTKAVRRPRRK